MGSGDLLSIGVFSLATGLSISALRHYDEVGPLKPASVDPHAGYRPPLSPAAGWPARLICALRRVDLPVDEVRQVLANPGDDALRTVLRRHRKQLPDRARALTRMGR